MNNTSSKKTKRPCIICAFEDTGSGRSMEVYYKTLRKSPDIFPIMAYTNSHSYTISPSFVTNKILYEIPPVDHEIEDCAKADCKKAPELHRTYKNWFDDCTEYIEIIKKLFGEDPLWMLDSVKPEIESVMKRNIIQVFHGDLFDIGISYYENYQSFYRYSLMLVQGQFMKNKLIERCHLDKNDARIVPIGRLLNNSLRELERNSEKNRKNILKQYKLKTNQKTILYAPSWEAKKYLPWGTRASSLVMLEKLCSDLSRTNHNIILRPHTILLKHFNLKDEYQKLSNKYPNVYFDDTTNYSEFGPNKSIHASDVLITDLSSIAIDFMSTGKPSIFMYPDKENSPLFGQIPNFKSVSKVSYAVKKYSDLIKTLHSLLQKKEPSSTIKNREKTVSWYTEKMHDDAEDRIVQTIGKIGKENQHFIRKTARLNPLSIMRKKPSLPRQYLFKLSLDKQND